MTYVMGGMMKEEREFSVLNPVSMSHANMFNLNISNVRTVEHV
jgi:hypothetical protein